jgi:hypothetical protein
MNGWREGIGHPAHVHRPPELVAEDAETTPSCQNRTQYNKKYTARKGRCQAISSYKQMAICFFSRCARHSVYSPAPANSISNRGRNVARLWLLLADRL